MNILITGGAGFTGVNFARHYLAQGYDVVVFDNLSRTGGLDNLAWLQRQVDAQRLNVIVGDVRLPPPSLEAEISSCDAVFHFAGQVAVTTSVTDPAHDFDVNARGTFNMLELVRTAGAQRPVFFYSSTNKVYGRMENVVTVQGERRYSYRDLPDGIGESQGLDFHSPYGCSKGSADQYVRDYARIYGLRTVVLRQSCIYGYRQFGIEDQGWVAWFVIATILGRQITIYGDGKQVRDILFIDDLITAYERAWQHIDTTAGRVYNIGGGPQNTISLLDLIDHLSTKLNRQIPLDYGDWRPGDQPVYVSDIRRAKEDFGWSPEIDWRVGVDRLLDWVTENKDLLAALL
ncbi:MAG: GDP-mannose 4,6-dehydratase [Planctomycetes bacterium]|nr:GDP-mannose 4,6-dehydratase [Planctomycetota bacterium]